MAQPAFPTGCTWQAAEPRTIVVGRFRPNTVRRILNYFQLFEILKIILNFQNS
jgi:hypothetical protein